MRASFYERLSALDQSFLAFETPNAYMHVAVTAIFEPGSLTTPHGAATFATVILIHSFISASLPAAVFILSTRSTSSLFVFVKSPGRNCLIRSLK